MALMKICKKACCKVSSRKKRVSGLWSEVGSMVGVNRKQCAEVVPPDILKSRRRAVWKLLGLFMLDGWEVADNAMRTELNELYLTAGDCHSSDTWAGNFRDLINKYLKDRGVGIRRPKKPLRARK